MAYAESLNHLPEQTLAIQRFITVVEHPEFSNLVDKGNITLAMIRPHTHDNRKNLSHTEATQRIIQSIREPLMVIGQASLIVSPEAVDELYQGEKESMIQVPSVSGKFPNRWKELLDLMTSGPITILLLYSSHGDAVPWWRTQMGDHWDPQRNPKGTIRREFATSAYNNLVHGSDSIGSAKRELAWAKKQLVCWAKRRYTTGI